MQQGSRWECSPPHQLPWLPCDFSAAWPPSQRTLCSIPTLPVPWHRQSPPELLLPPLSPSHSRRAPGHTGTQHQGAPSPTPHLSLPATPEVGLWGLGFILRSGRGKEEPRPGRAPPGTRVMEAKEDEDGRGRLRRGNAALGQRGGIPGSGRRRERGGPGAGREAPLPAGVSG